MDIEVYTLNAFAKGQAGGNPAGVVLHATSLSAQQMQEVAREVGFSETAFVSASTIADYKVRFFTPNSEVDLCGHATIAAFYYMHAQGFIAAGRYTLETKAGILEVRVQVEGDVYLAQSLPQFYEVLDKARIADSLHISPEELVDELPIQIVSTGLRDILIPVKSLDVLKGINPDFKRIAEISKEYNVIGYHLFTLDTPIGSLAECRNLAPLYEIPEESATGTSNGALLCYLYQYGKLTQTEAQHVLFKQGYTMNLPSEIKARLSVDKDQHIIKVEVGGIASNIERRRINL